MNKIDEIYGINTKKITTWFKVNAWAILAAFAFGYIGGSTMVEVRIDLDCKYSKATRIGTNSYSCLRIV